MNEHLTQAGHGDLYLRRVEASAVPEQVQTQLRAAGERQVVLAEGEKTGHRHLLTSDGPIGHVRVDDTVAYVLLEKAGLLTHEEHGERVLAPGYYEVPTERDYDPAQYERRVVD